MSKKKIMGIRYKNQNCPTDIIETLRLYEKTTIRGKFDNSSRLSIEKAGDVCGSKLG
jgi:hypothetical protein